MKLKAEQLARALQNEPQSMYWLAGDEPLLVHHRSARSLLVGLLPLFSCNISCRTSDPSLPHFSALLQRWGIRLRGCMLRRAMSARQQKPAQNRTVVTVAVISITMRPRKAENVAKPRTTPIPVPSASRSPVR